MKPKGRCMKWIPSGHYLPPTKQCSRKNGHGAFELYCKQHAKQIAKQNGS